MIRLLLLFLCFSTVHAYHPTESILLQLNFLCSQKPYLTCTYHDDILVVDWLKDQPYDTLWVFNEHARERITAEVALHTIQQLVIEKPEKRVTIIPILNVWGRKEVEKGKTCQRKNKRGVDTNRNYQLGISHSYRKYGEEYEGPHPLSEKETQLVSSILRQGVKRYINIHSGEFSLYMPYDSVTSPPPNADKMRQFLDTLHPLCPECKKGSAAEVSFYKAYGTSVDYAIHNDVPEAYTFEVFGSDNDECEDMFNPKNETKIKNQWSKILMTSLNIQ